jgi:hypothetical protein
MNEPVSDRILRREFSVGFIIDFHSSSAKPFYEGGVGFEEESSSL